MNCKGCLSVINADNYLRCRSCNECFHHTCLNMSDGQFKSLPRAYKTSWTCPSCNNVTRRMRNNLNTPVKQHEVPVVDNTMEMSFDIHENSVATTSFSDPVPCQSGCNGVTMEKISALFDDKLNASLAGFMTNFRSVLKDDIKDMVRSEMSCVVKELKDDLNSATDFFSSEQQSLKSQIADKNANIKILEANCERLHGDLRKLTDRISAMEKTTRSYNIEIQAVPENRNENVTLLFKTLCNIINFPIEDSCIHACRRVAKMDNTSKRPRNILVTLFSPRMKDSILSAVQRFNKGQPKDTLSSNHLGISGETHKIYVVEHLSPECKQLHAAARKFAREKHYKYVWVKYGRVYLRKDDQSGLIFVKNLDALHKLA